MSFGSGFGGFGQNNNQSSGFGGGGGFGSNTATTSGFGSNNNSTGFGGTANTTTGTSIFGGGGSTGTGTGGFGSTNTTSAFGAKPAFGSSSTGGGLFGSSASTTNATGGFGSGGGFGSTTNATTGFGSAANTGGTMFGSANKTSAFGAGNTGGGLFGASSNNNTTTSGFGATATNNQQSGGLFGGNQTATAFGNAVPEAQGTGGTAFTPFQEKETNSNITNHFQTLTFMAPYAKHSFEELRLADYQKGQKHGSGGQAGAFGQSTGFGGGFGAANNTTTTNTGFGSTSGGGLFGNNAAASTSGGFGSTTATTGGFGANAGGGGFGANKLGTGNSLFGAANTTNNTTSTGFGTGGGGMFGGGNNNQAQQGGGLFGNNNNNQAKPGLFGAPATTTTTTGFGGTGGAFGNTNAQQPAGSGLFGNNQAQANNNPFGGATNNNAGGFGGGFGNNNNAAKPAGGLFGAPAANTGSSLFGNTQPQQNTGFGANQNQQQAGGLFGNAAQNQPSSGGLFGNANTQAKPNMFGNSTAGTGGLFGNNQQQQQQQQGGGGLFGNNQPQQQNTGFGGGMFGGSQQNTQANTGLFGNSQNNNSILGGSQQQQVNPLQGPAGYTASLADPSPYGSASIFNGLPPPPQASPGPIATPINAGSLRARKPAALPQYKLNPAAAARLITPQKRPGYGLSYSTYGTPSSVSSVTSTPGALSGSLLGSTLGRSLGKSFSTSNLRSQLEAEPSVLGAGAFSGSFRSGGSGSLKRLTIDRSLRTDLFGPQPVAAPPASSSGTPAASDETRPSSSLKKKVSFDTNSAPEPAEEQLAIQSPTPTAQESGFIRRDRNAPRASLPLEHEKAQIQGNELAIVHEDEASSAEPAQARPNLFKQGEPKPGEYWMKPSLAELKKMTKSELKALKGFEVGRNNCGFVHFDEPVDLASVSLEAIINVVVVISPRRLTVYPENAYKPPMGKGLNVPSTITLENCWPRGRDRVTPVPEKTGPRVTKHVERLKRVENTEFVNYNKDNGQWSFRVPHFTTYGLDDDDEGSDAPEDFGDSVMSELPPTPTPRGKQVRILSTSDKEAPPSSSALSSVPSDVMSLDIDDSQVSSALGDDTFGYKRGKRFPGAFDDTPAFDDSDHEDDGRMDMVEHGKEPGSPASAASEDEPTEIKPTNDRQMLLHTATSNEDLTMAGAFPDADDQDDFLALETPTKLIPDLNADWADRLRDTISPRKNDRHFLKKSQALLDRGDSLIDLDATPVASAEPVTSMGEIKTSVDLMRSLFGKEEARRTVRQEEKTGSKWPFNKRASDKDLDGMNDQDSKFHQTFKTGFTPQNRVVYRERPNQIAIYNIDEEHKDHALRNFWRLAKQTKIAVDDGVPAAHFEPQPFDHEWGVKDYAHDQEPVAWELMHILFDDYSDEISNSIPASELARYRHRIRKDRLVDFWARICEPAATQALHQASSPEERALAYLSMHKVNEACGELTQGKNFRLATLVAQIAGDATQKDEMRSQLETWARDNVISEMTDPIRAILSLVAGETSFVEGKKGSPEDQAVSFVISEKFKLDWKQAFGLRLWYGTLPEESLESAIQHYVEDLGDANEVAKPTPWFLEPNSKVKLDWKDPNPGTRYDLLWAILLLLSEQTLSTTTVSLAEAVSPENVVGKPMSYRLSFELHQMLASHLSRSVDAAKADALCAAYSASLEAHGHWSQALWVLLFLQEPEQRKHAIQAALARMAPSMRDEKEVRETVFDRMKIPESWVWDAQAVLARANNDKFAEVKYLGRGHNWTEAHRVLCEDVAPIAIIERQHSRLNKILEQWPTKNFPEWRLGGQVLEDYLAIINGKLGSVEQRVIIGRFTKALAELKPQAGDGRKIKFAQNVALSEMTRVATEQANELDTVDGDWRDAMTSLSLPGNEDIRRSVAREMSMEYFKAKLAGTA